MVSDQFHINSILDSSVLKGIFKSALYQSTLKPQLLPTDSL